MLKPLVPKFCPDQSARLKDIAKKQIPAKLKPMVVGYVRHWECAELCFVSCFDFCGLIFTSCLIYPRVCRNYDYEQSGSMGRSSFLKMSR